MIYLSLYISLYLNAQEMYSDYSSLTNEKNRNQFLVTIMALGTDKGTFL